VLSWDEVQANNKEGFPDPRLPTLEAVPEFIRGELQIHRVKVPWGEYTTYSVSLEGYSVSIDIDEKTIEPVEVDH
jgi:hypothetical protein